MRARFKPDEPEMEVPPIEAFEFEARQATEEEILAVAEWIAGTEKWKWLSGDASNPESLEDHNGVWIDPATGGLKLRAWHNDLDVSVGSWIVADKFNDFFPWKEDEFNDRFELYPL